jgi:Sulfotransferase family
MLNLIPSQSSIISNMLSQVHARRGRHLAPAETLPPAPFIVGSPRSGTTLLSMMLDSHPQLAIPPETGFIPGALAALFGTEERQRHSFVQALGSFPPPSTAWQDFGIEQEALERELQEITPFHVDAATRCFYRMYAARFGKTRWGDKTPSYGRHMKAIERLLPEASFIHIIRDGRDAALALRDSLSPDTDMGGLARQWRRDICAIRRQSLTCQRYLELHYESLVADPATCLREICTCIEIDYDPAMLTRRRISEQRSILSPPDSARVNRWQAEMSAAERAEFEAVAGGLLAALGYSSA